MFFNLWNNLPYTDNPDNKKLYWKKKQKNIEIALYAAVFRYLSQWLFINF